MLGSISSIPPSMAVSYTRSFSTQNMLVWYRVQMSAGTFIQLNLTFSASNDFDLYLTATILTAQNMAGRTIPDSDLANSISSSYGSEHISYTV